MIIKIEQHQILEQFSRKTEAYLVANGSTSHLFYNCGVIQFNKEFFKDDQALELL